MSFVCQSMFTWSYVELPAYPTLGALLYLRRMHLVHVVVKGLVQL